MNYKNSLESLSDRITNAAHAVARSWGGDPADVEQDIVLAILERYTQDPDFLDRTPAYIVTWGVWRAKNVLEHQVIVGDKFHIPDDPLPNDPDTTLLDLLPSHVNVEETALTRACLSALNDQTQAIAQGLMEGRTTREIGMALGVSAMTVCNRKAAIAQAMA